jgi:hypothetical protein
MFKVLLNFFSILICAGKKKYMTHSGNFYYSDEPNAFVVAMTPIHLSNPGSDNFRIDVNYATSGKRSKGTNHLSSIPQTV